MEQMTTPPPVTSVPPSAQSGISFRRALVGAMAVAAGYAVGWHLLEIEERLRRLERKFAERTLASGVNSSCDHRSAESARKPPINQSTNRSTMGPVDDAGTESSSDDSDNDDSEPAAVAVDAPNDTSTTLPNVDVVLEGDGGQSKDETQDHDDDEAPP